MAIHISLATKLLMKPSCLNLVLCCDSWEGIRCFAAVSLPQIGFPASSSTILHTLAHLCTLLHTFAQSCTTLHTFAHFCTLAHTLAHPCTHSHCTQRTSPHCIKYTQNTVQCRVYIHCTLGFLLHFCTAAGEWNQPALLLVIICSSVADNVYKIIITTSWFSVTFVGSMAGDQEIIYSLNQLIRKNRWSERFFM